MRKDRRFALGAALLALAMLLGACGSGGSEDNAGSGGGNENKGTITVGVSGNFAENQIVAEMYAQVLENAGYTVKRQLELGTREISDPALFSGRIDVKPEYLAYELLKLDPKAEDTSDPQAAADALRPLLEEKGVELLDYTQANDTNAFVVTQETADRLGVSTMSDLAASAGQLTLGAPPDCKTNALCLPGLKDTYGIEFKEYKPLDVGGPRTVAAVKSGAVDVGELFSTDAAIAENDFVTLEDDKQLQAAGQIAPVIRDSKNNAEITNLLNQVSAKLTTENVTELVAKVTVDQEDPAEVAEEFLRENGLLT